MGGKKEEVTLSKECMRELVETCPSCQEIYKTAIKIKTAKPELKDSDILSALLEAVGDDTMDLMPDPETLKRVEEEFLS